MSYLVPIIMGSQSDIDFGLKIKESLQVNFSIQADIRICSAHKSCNELLKIINYYDSIDDSVKVYITIAGKSNALSALIDGNSSKPIIACPPITNETMYDIYSSISMPSGISPLTILGYENAAVSAAKIISLFDKNVEKSIRQYKKNMITKLHIQDIKCKYELNFFENSNIDSILKKTVNDTNSYLSNNTEKEMILLRTGKVRDIYTSTSYLSSYIMIASDRVSAFDRHLTTIPYKGCVLHKVSMWWFAKTKDMVPNHIVSSIDDRTMVVKKCKVIPIEFVMRAYLTGSTETSIWKNYEKGSRLYCGHKLEDGMVKNQKLPNILLTPTTKDEHDEIISEQEIYDRKIISEDIFKKCSEYAFKLFNYGQQVAKERGLILVDTKYEFGIDNTGNVLLIDELHTPDSSRYWLEHSYKDNFFKNKDPDSIDKEVVRKWVRTNCGDPYNLDNKIEIPDDIRLLLSSKYLQLHELITGSCI